MFYWQFILQNVDPIEKKHSRFLKDLQKWVGVLVNTVLLMFQRGDKFMLFSYCPSFDQLTLHLHRCETRLKYGISASVYMIKIKTWHQYLGLASQSIPFLYVIEVSVHFMGSHWEDWNLSFKFRLAWAPYGVKWGMPLWAFHWVDKLILAKCNKRVDSGRQLCILFRKQVSSQGNYGCNENISNTITTNVYWATNSHWKRKMSGHSYASTTIYWRMSLRLLTLPRSSPIKTCIIGFEG